MVSTALPPFAPPLKETEATFVLSNDSISFLDKGRLILCAGKILTLPSFSSPHCPVEANTVEAIDTVLYCPSL